MANKDCRPILVFSKDAPRNNTINKKVACVMFRFLFSYILIYIFIYIYIYIYIYMPFDICIYIYMLSALEI